MWKRNNVDIHVEYMRAEGIMIDVEKSSTFLYSPRELEMEIKQERKKKKFKKWKKEKDVRK